MAGAEVGTFLITVFHLNNAHSVTFLFQELDVFLDFLNDTGIVETSEQVSFL